jgi:Ca2+-binding RTX toxin-like protein
VSVNWATRNGTALAGSDYEAATGSLTFAPGQTVKTVDVVVRDDTTTEGAESFELALSTLSGATLGSRPSSVTIAASDGAPLSLPFLPTLTIGDAYVNEGDGLARFLVRLSAASTEAVTVRWATERATASDVSDFDGTDGQLLFNPGEVVKTVTVALDDRDFAEALESFFVTLEEATGANIGRTSGIGTIFDDDGPTQTSPLLAVSGGTIDERDGVATFVVSLDARSTAPVSVNWATRNGTALAGSDYEAATGSLTFAPGQTVKTVDVVVRDDPTDEVSQSFSLVLSGASGGSLVTSSATMTILDNDPVPAAKLVLRGTTAADRLAGRSGSDTVVGFGGNDYLVAGNGNDAVYGGDGRDSVFGGFGSDRLFGGNDVDRLAGGFDNDVISGGNDADVILGDQGNDRVTGGNGNDRLFGGDGHDSLLGEAGNDRTYGGNDDDRVSGGDGNDIVLGSFGNDRADGGEGNDRLFGGDDRDVLLGSLGEDRLEGDNGSDVLYGGDGADVLLGDAEDDRVYGGNDADLLLGGVGADFVFGGNDADSLSGSSGNDRLDGGLGNDRMSGGTDADVFDIGLNEGTDTITDFVSGIDRLDLREFNFASGAAVRATASTVSGGISLNLPGSGSLLLLGLATPAGLADQDMIL